VSTPRTVPTEGVKTSERTDATGLSQASRDTADSGARSSSGSPEWATERWKLEVEAEARSRLKKHLQGAGAKR
jgi:hypothetical protein